MGKMKRITKQKILAVVFSVLPIVVYLLLLVLMVIVSVIVQADYDKVFIFMNTASLAGASAIMCAVLKRRTGKGLRDALSIKQFDWCLLLFLLFFLWCAGEVTDGIVVGICSKFMSITPNASVQREPLRIIEAVLLAPVFEEILFRFLGMEFAKKQFSAPVLCVANAIFFALMHGYNIQGFFNIMVFAVCVAYVYLKTGRLLYAILVHIIHNALCLIDYGDAIFFGSPIHTEKNGFVLGSPQWIAVNLMISVFCAIIYFRRYKKKQSGNKLEAA